MRIWRVRKRIEIPGKDVLLTEPSAQLGFAQFEQRRPHVQDSGPRRAAEPFQRSRDDEVDSARLDIEGKQSHTLRDIDADQRAHAPAVGGERLEIASIRGRRGHGRQQRDPHVRGPVCDEIFFPHPGFPRTQGHGVEDETVPRGHAGEQKVQARETVGRDENSTLRTVLAGKRVDHRVERGRDILRTRERSLGCVDEEEAKRKVLSIAARHWRGFGVYVDSTLQTSWRVAVRLLAN